MQATEVKPTWQFAKDFARLLQPYRRNIGYALLWIGAMQTLALVEPALMMLIIDSVVRGSSNRTGIAALCAGAVMLRLFNTKVKVWKDQRSRLAATDAYHDLPILCGNKLIRLPIAWHQQEHSGEIMSSITDGTRKVMDLLFVLLYEVVPVFFHADHYRDDRAHGRALGRDGHPAADGRDLLLHSHPRESAMGRGAAIAASAGKGNESGFVSSCRSCHDNASVRSGRKGNAHGYFHARRRSPSLFCGDLDV